MIQVVQHNEHFYFEDIKYIWRLILLLNALNTMIEYIFHHCRHVSSNASSRVLLLVSVCLGMTL